MCPNREYISSPGAQVSRLRRMESLQLAVVCPKGGSNKQKERTIYKKGRFISRFVLFWQRIYEDLLDSGNRTSVLSEMKK